MMRGRALAFITSRIRVFEIGPRSAP